MTSSLGCRKRGRVEDTDCDECMPISKRINRLQIQHSEPWNSNEDQDGDAALNNNLQIGPADCCQHGQQEWSIANGTWHHSYNMNHWQPQPNAPISPLPQSGMDRSGPGLHSLSSAHSGPSTLAEQSLAFSASSGLNGGGQLSPVLPQPNSPALNPVGLDILSDLSTYNPDLRPEENPNYYHSNQMLFEAHRERMTRVIDPKGQH